MALTSGTKLGPYEILAPLGAGGMGEVYRARDTKLNREVALKVLPQAFANDAERMARFEREAQVLASLNHPNIAAIYGLEESGPTHALVMELVEGMTLAELLQKTKIDIRNSKIGPSFDPSLRSGQVFRSSSFDPLPIACQIAEALEYAHERGIIHRDLKPANIKMTPEGKVKVLDFGLAKALERTVPASGVGAIHESPLQNSPTLTAASTQAGVILGTAAYMSPEQAKGRPVDRRTDIWAFGCVFYEMLTGNKAFEGETTSDVLAAVIRAEPDWNAMPGDTPAPTQRLLRRCLTKDPNLRLRDIGEARITLLAPEQEAPPLPAAERKDAPSLRRGWWPVAMAVFIAIAFAAGWWLHGPQPSPPPWKVTRLTADPGLSDFAALSPDGKLVAYASDRSPDGEPDIYVKQVAGGQAIRLTSDGTGNTTPDFSPDGSKIVFRSNRDGGGVYVVPAFGGEARLLARDGLSPKFSPDGSQVAYWVGAEGVAPAIPGSGTVWVVPAAGGRPQRVGPNFTAARNPIWSPDGKRLLLIGYTAAKAYQASGIDWWLVPTNGGDAARTGAYEAWARAGLLLDRANDFRIPACWSAASNTVIFSAVSGDAFNLWEIGISPRTGRVSGPLKRLTTGAANEVHASCAAGGALTFTNEDTRTDLWSLRVDLDRGTPKGTLERITQGPAARDYASLSTDGRHVAFASDQSGTQNIWVRDLVTGKESSVDSSSLVERFPVINASGTRVAFSVYEKDRRAVYVSAPGGAPERLCEGCLEATDWSRDEKTVLVFGGDPYQINLLDLASHQQSPLLKHVSHQLIYGRFSPDNRWVSFTVRTEPNRGYIAIAPIHGPKPIPESAWITIAPAQAQDWANWSPDGKTLYFTSRRDGHFCLWGQRLDASSHRPAGEAFALQHLHGRVSYQQGGWSAAGGRVGLVLVEHTGNIWMMSRSSAE